MRWMVSAILVAGCASAQPQAQTRTTAVQAAPVPQMGIGRGTGMGLCSAIQAGARVQAEDTVDGAAIAVVAPESRQLEMRSLLRQMATRHEQTRVGGRPEHHENLPPHSTSVEDTEQGARLLFRPDQPDELQALRAGVRKHVEWLSTHCPKP